MTRFHFQRREKVFHQNARAVPLDRNAKARIQAYAEAYNARHRKPRQHKGPLTRTYLAVLEALLWCFHNSHSGACFPSYERIAEKAECARSVVAEAIKALEAAGVLTWQNRITRVRVRCRDLFGRQGWHWRVIRTSNAYVFHDPKLQHAGRPASKSENRTGTQNQELSLPAGAAPAVPAVRSDALKGALARLGVTLAGAGRLADT
jgi:hypothetical protein